MPNFTARMPGYSPTPLRSLGGYARELGIRGLLVKDESSRMGINAFKIAGVAYALHRLRSSGALKPDSVLACATDGNHGRAVAHVARELKLHARIYIHKGASPARVQAIRDEGAEVAIIDGNYDDSVRQIARDAQQHGWTIDFGHSVAWLRASPSRHHGGIHDPHGRGCRAME